MKEQYKFKAWIFLTIFIINSLYLGQIIKEEGIDIIKPYKKIMCPNTTMTPCAVPQTLNQTIQPGEYIENRAVNLEAANNFNKSVIISLIIGIITNHLIYNRK